MVMKQVATQHPVAWRPDEQRPFTIFASDISWTDQNISIDINLPVTGDAGLVGVRANPNDCCGRVITAEDLMPGVCITKIRLIDE
jgi:hypothetical protein